jgi:acyl-CoA thioester hydrolase
MKSSNRDMTEINFPIKLKLRIDWGDVDSFGHVNNVSIFRYIQAARVKYIDKIGLSKIYKDFKIGPILASCKCEFTSPLFYPGNIIVRSRVEYIKNTSFCIHHQVIDSKLKVSAEAQDIIVVYDFNRNMKVQLPKEIRNQIEKLEKKAF